MNPKVPFSFREAEPGPCSDFHINHRQAFVSSPNCAPVLRVHLTNLKSWICLDDEKYSPQAQAAGLGRRRAKTARTSPKWQMKITNCCCLRFYILSSFWGRRMFKRVSENKHVRVRSTSFFHSQKNQGVERNKNALNEQKQSCHKQAKVSSLLHSFDWNTGGFWWSTL